MKVSFLERHRADRLKVASQRWRVRAVQEAIFQQYRNLNLANIIVLDIPDDYRYMSDELIEMIQTSTEDILSGFDFD